MPDNEPPASPPGEEDIIFEEELEIGILLAINCGAISAHAVDERQCVEHDDSLGWS